MTNYAAVSDVQARLINHNIGVDGSYLVDDEDIVHLLQEADDMINFELDIATNTTEAKYTPILKMIEVNHVAMSILRGRHYKHNNEVENVDKFWTIMPEFTFADMRRLRIIRQRLRGNSVSKNYNTQTGYEVATHDYYGGYFY
jgi:hypothetical protein